MFVGHLAAGLALKARVRETPLWWLLLGAVAADLVCGVLLMLGVEDVVVEGALTFQHIRSDMGYSHALSSTLATALVVGFTAARVGGSRRVGAAVGLSVLSHFVLDVLTHRHDMALLGLGAAHDLRLGTNLALHPWAMFALEVLWCLFAWWLFDPHNRRLLGTIVVLLLLYTNALFGFLALPTPSAAGLGGMMLASFTIATLVVLRAARRSEPRRPVQAPGGVRGPVAS
jgi:hypothetical protein